MMDYIEPVLTLFVLASIWIAYQLTRRFIPTYIEKKAEHLASTEDIGRITDIVESVRSQHAGELEKLRSNLELMRDDLTSVRGEGRAAATKFFEDAATLALDKLEVPPEDIGYHTGSSVSDYRRDVIEKLTQLVIRHAWLLTYFHEDDAILEAADKIVSTAKRVRIQILSSFDKLVLAELENQRAKVTDTDTITALTRKELRAVADYRQATESAISEFVEAFTQYSAKLSTFLHRRILE